MPERPIAAIIRSTQTTDIIPASQARNEGITPVDPVALLLADKRSPQTRRAYAADLKVFFGDPSPERVRAFVALPASEVALRLAAWKAQMLAEGKAEATINRRLAAVKSLLKFAHRLGLATTDGRNLIDGEKVENYRDTRGIDVAGMRALLDAARDHPRDFALFRLLCENALRRAEVCGCEVSDFDPARATLKIVGKGKGTQKVAVTLSSGTVQAIAAYLAARGHKTGALFRNRCGGPLQADGLHHIVVSYGRKIGVTALAPHKLRHSAITAALDAGLDVRQVQKLSRHAKIETLLRYDDARHDFQGQVSKKLAEVLFG